MLKNLIEIVRQDEQVIGMTEVNMIHESDVYFDVINENGRDYSQMEAAKDQMHHGEMYICLDQIYFRDNSHWYKANIKDIKKVHTNISRKQLCIQFWNYDVILSCNEIAHLMALRDLLFLLRNNPTSNTFIHPGTKPMEVCTVQ